MLKFQLYPITGRDFASASFIQLGSQRTGWFSSTVPTAMDGIHPLWTGDAPSRPASHQPPRGPPAGPAGHLPCRHPLHPREAEVNPGQAGHPPWRLLHHLHQPREGEVDPQEAKARRRHHPDARAQKPPSMCRTSLIRRTAQSVSPPGTLVGSHHLPLSRHIPR